MTSVVKHIATQTSIYILEIVVAVKFLNLKILY